MFMVQHVLIKRGTVFITKSFDNLINILFNLIIDY